MQLTETAETVFPAVPESVGAARRFTRAALSRHGVGAEITDTALLLVSELATNAIVHASSTIRLRIGVGEEIRVEVLDGSEDAPVVGSSGPENESGRGLSIVATLADTWDWTSTATGKVVWFALARGEPVIPDQVR